VPEQPELTIQGWGPAAGPRDATVARGADGDSARLELTAFPDLAEVLPEAARRHLPASSAGRRGAPRRSRCPRSGWPPPG
jgi:hypothetical protein